MAAGIEAASPRFADIRCIPRVWRFRSLIVPAASSSGETPAKPLAVRFFSFLFVHAPHLPTNATGRISAKRAMD